MVHKVILSGLQRTWKQARLKTRRLEVSALIGKAGTGKSYCIVSKKKRPGWKSVK